MYRKEKQTKITIENVKNYRDKSAGYFLFFSKKNKVEELQTEHKNSRLSTWLGCCVLVALKYPKTQFSFYVSSENAPNLTCYIKYGLATVPSLHSFFFLEF